LYYYISKDEKNLKPWGVHQCSSDCGMTLAQSWHGNSLVKFIFRLWHDENMEYTLSITSWGLASAKTMDPLNKIYKCIIRIMTKSAGPTHTSPLFHKLNILKIKDIHNLKTAKTMYKYHNDQCT